MRPILSGVSRAILDRQTIATGFSSPARSAHIWALNNQINGKVINGLRDRQNVQLLRHK
ncbi:unnamed protein product [Orchesella dallaii]|uniref:Uncharacterized protein n=1 Tax=Orchesella dallaii TaxID=48710 RepID=A0ABP1PYN2_9HEXA